MRNKTKSVYGVGVNNADYSVTTEIVIEGNRPQVLVCPFYLAWHNILTRCYSAKSHSARPTYVGCSAIPEWHSFLSFRAWMAAQDWEGKQLDKDILIKGNKLYSPDTCVFVPGTLNRFMADSGATRGEYPIGVNWHKKSGKLASSCRNPFSGKREHLGLFDCPNEAHEAWRRRKHELACIYADQQTDPRIADALRIRYATVKGMAI